jgi:hypothetical protein
MTFTLGEYEVCGRAVSRQAEENEIGQFRIVDEGASSQEGIDARSRAVPSYSAIIPRLPG